jgi:monovalent cation:H+ antiporter-2, CPA2 family
MAKETCAHLNQIRHVSARTQGCEECLASGDSWVNLRLCMTCGHIGCCDSSRNKHATKHFHATRHAIMRSAEPQEDWGWCFVDQVMLAPEDLGMGTAAEGPTWT